MKANHAEEELEALKAQRPTEAQKPTDAPVQTAKRVGGRQKKKAAYITGGAEKGGTAPLDTVSEPGKKRKRTQPVAEEGEETEEDESGSARRVRRKDSDCPVMQK